MASNATNEIFKEVSFRGIRGLFTREILNTSTVPYGLFLYHVMAAEDGCTPIALRIQRIVGERYLGTLLLTKAIPVDAMVKSHDPAYASSLVCSSVDFEVTEKEISLKEFVETIKSVPKGYMTAYELVQKALLDAKADTEWNKNRELAELDYIHVEPRLSTLPEMSTLRICEFDVYSTVVYGASEGIYADIYLNGRFTDNVAFHKGNLHIATLKTLSTSKDAYLAMHQYAALVCYYARSYVNSNLNRFD